MKSDDIYILALLAIKGIGDQRIITLINHFKSTEKVWNLSKKDLISINNIGEKSILNIGNPKYLEIAEQELELCKNNGINIISYFDDNYPKLLKEINNPPVLIFTKGSEFTFDWSKNISIVGTRKMTTYGKLFIEELIDGLKEFDVNIISGLAYGCDIFAHKKAIENNLPTWAVLAQQLNSIYPSTHKSTAEKMLENGGWIAEKPFFSGINPSFFLQRNRIIAGLSHVTIMAESAPHGGSMVTAKHANEYNRDVFALPGKATDLYSKGCNYLIKTHQAYLIENSKDLIYHLNLDNKKEIETQLNLFEDFTEEELLIVNFLKTNGKTHIDSLALGLDKFSYELMPILLDLELNKYIQPLPGKFYEVII